jgi:hypothetical protein
MRSLHAHVLMIVAIFAMATAAGADVPASTVFTRTVTQGQSYPGVDANSEGWFDVGGFCKVVDVGDLSALAPNAHGVPVFVPGPANQWENYRTLAASRYNGQLTLTTCCRPQSGIASLCTEAGATLVAVNRQYGKNGETDEVTATCTDQWGRTYTDSVAVTCTGDNGPDGQAQWVESAGDVTSNCTADAYDTGCSAACDSSSTGTRYDSCGVPTNYTCYGGACPPPPTPPTTGSTEPTACASGTIMAECSVWPAYRCTDPNPPHSLLPTIYSDCGGECQALGLSGGAPSTWPDASHTFTLPTCTCTTGTHGGCPAWTGQATCSICN